MAGISARPCPCLISGLPKSAGSDLLPPLRIASLQPSITLTLQRLGRLDDLVACTRYCVEALPELARRNLNIVADSWSSTMEELLAVEPNLVIASVPYRMESLAAILRAGCPVLTLAPIRSPTFSRTSA